MTRPYAEVIGDPIAQSKSPLIHGFWLEALGHRCRVSRCACDAPTSSPTISPQRRADPDWRGCNVTMPHKQAALELVDGSRRHRASDRRDQHASCARATAR